MALIKPYLLRVCYQMFRSLPHHKPSTDYYEESYLQRIGYEYGIYDEFLISIG